MKVGFIGAGKMATAIAAGMLERGGFDRGDILAADVSAEARDAFEKATGIVCSADSADVASKSDAVLLAVKPQVGEEVATALGDALDGKLLVSILAGTPISTLSRWTGHGRVFRVMPNTPLMVGLGAVVFSQGPEVADTDRKLVETVFGANGIVRELPEKLMDAVTALSGSGPAYFFEMIDALAEAGEHAGIPAETALELVAWTAAGAAEMVKAGRFGTPRGLRDAVTSPGGTTAAGLKVMGDAGFRKLMSEVVDAARKRSIELGGGK
jgi:pyrroline-5-carboxylate reductase